MRALLLGHCAAAGHDGRLALGIAGGLSCKWYAIRRRVHKEERWGRTGITASGTAHTAQTAAVSETAAV